jgi:hypothetical protein
MGADYQIGQYRVLEKPIPERDLMARFRHCGCEMLRHLLLNQLPQTPADRGLFGVSECIVSHFADYPGGSPSPFRRKSEEFASWLLANVLGPRPVIASCRSIPSDLSLPVA